MTQTMIERIAQKIYERRNGNGCKSFGRLQKSHQEPYLADARAAIDALFDSSDAIIDAMEEMHMPFGDMSMAWLGAIIAILNEGRGK